MDVSLSLSPSFPFSLKINKYIFLKIYTYWGVIDISACFSTVKEGEKQEKLFSCFLLFSLN